MKNKKLHNIKTTGFKTPDSYFESVEDQILDKLKEETFLKDIEEAGYSAPDSYFESIEDQVMFLLNDGARFDDIKDTGLKTPNDYFETIEDKVFANLNEDKVVKVIPIFSRRNMLYVSGIAAAILILFGIFVESPYGNDPDSLDLEIVETYLEQQDLDAYDIASLLTEEDLSQDDFGIINDSFSEESLEDYLIDNANLEDIIEQ